MARCTSKKPRRKKKIQVYVYPQEAEEIGNNAALASMSLSTFLRQIGLGLQPKARIDINMIGDMSKIASDLNRLGGLLKLWLTDEPRRHGQDQNIRSVKLSLVWTNSGPL